MSKIAVVVVAGGVGSRMGTDVPKQFLPLGDSVVLMQTVGRVHELLPGAEIVVVLSKKEFQRWEDLKNEYAFDVPHKVCEGGESRYESVQRGIKCVNEEAELIVVHDGVRPILSDNLLKSVIDQAVEHGAAIPVVKSSDTLRVVCGETSEVVDRNMFRMVQTPQAFRADMLRRAYGEPYSELFTDDASVVEAAGYDVVLCDGEYSNIKITNPVDIAVAAELLKVLK